MADDRTTAQEKLNELLKDNLDISQQLAEYEDNRVDKYAVILSELEKEQLLAHKSLSLTEKKIKQAETLINKGADLTEEQLKNLDILRESTEELKRMAKEGKKVASMAEDIGGSATHILSKFFGINASVMKFGNALKKAGGTGAYLKRTMAQVSSQVTMANVAAAGLLKTYEKLSEVAGDVKKAMVGDLGTVFDPTNAMENALKRNEEFRKSFREMNVMGVQAQNELRLNMEKLDSEVLGTTADDFLKINETMRKTSVTYRELAASNNPLRFEMLKTSNMLNKTLKVPFETQITITDTLTRSFGHSAKGAMDFQASVAVMANEMGLHGTKVLKDFAANATSLAKFNIPDLQGELLRLGKASDATGIGMGTLVGAMDNFSTIQGSLTAASKLNAVFGTTMDGMEIMNEYMRKGGGPLSALALFKEQSGDIDFKELNPAEMRVLKETLSGFDETQIRALGKLPVEKLRQLQTKGLDAAEAMKELGLEQAGNVTMEEKMSEAMSQATLAMKGLADNLEKVHTMMAGFGSENVVAAMALQKFGDIGLWLGGTVLQGAVFGGMTKVMSGTGGFTASMGTMAKGLGRVAGGAMGAMAALDGVRRAATGKTTGEKLMGFGEAVMGGAALGGSIGGLHGAAIGAVAGGVGALGGAIFGEMAPGQNYVSQPQIATVGEAGAELVTKRSQRLLNAGDKVTRDPTTGEPTNLKLTVNMVTKEGKVLESQNVEKSFDATDPSFDTAVSTVLNEKLSLIFS